MKHKLNQDYRELRRQHYPPIEDQMDAILKGGKELEDMRKRVQEVKDRFPKK